MHPTLRYAAASSILLLIFLTLAPAASSLDIAARSVKARPSAEYTPATAWDLGHYGCGVTVAIFDAGVDDQHPNLVEKVLAGYDATENRLFHETVNDGNPQPFIANHGTPVAGLVGSHGGQPFFAGDDVPTWTDDDLVGMAPCTWMVDVSFSDSPETVENFEDRAIKAFGWAIAHRNDDWGDSDPRNDGIDIITMSWSPEDGTDGSDPISQAANAAVEAGIVVLGSMGNSGPDYQPWGTPAAADLTIGVANLNISRTVDRADDQITPGSTIGPRPDDGDDDPYEELKPDIAAPGFYIMTTGASLTDGTDYQYACFGPDDFYSPYHCESRFAGTSAATPVAAGIVALMLSANGNLTPADVKEILHQSAERHPNQTAHAPELSAVWDRAYGYGMIDAYRAVVMATQWPGMEIGKDTDADGVRDFMDDAPRDPANATIKIPAGFTALGGHYDTDGDLVPDAQDPDPLNPGIATAEDLAAPAPPPSTPTVGPVLVVVVIGLALLAHRRRLR